MGFMTKVTREEVLKLAEMSKLRVLDNEISSIISDLEGVLSYAQGVMRIVAENFSATSEKNINVMRDDIVVPTISSPIVAQAPESEDNYFVVPKILD